MTAVSVKPWTNLEHWTLFTFYKGDSKEDWHARAAADMEATRKARIERRPKGFFTPAKCKEEFDRIMAEPCPSDVPTGADYSRTAVVDAWIKYFTEEDRKDAELFEELMQVKIRSYEERIMKVWGNRDSYKVEQLEKMLEEIKKEEDEEETEYRERLGLFYHKHISEKLRNEREKKAAASRPSSVLPRAPHSPRKMPGQRSRDIVEKAERSNSPTKSPNRASAGDDEPMSVTVKEEDHGVEKMEVDEAESKLSDGLDSPRSQPDAKRPRGRPPKKTSSAATLTEEASTRDGSPMSVKDQQKSPTRTETRRSSARGEASANTSSAEKDSIHVVDSPAGRVRGARRPMAVDSPLVGKTSNVGRTSAGADSPHVREGSREREYAKSRLSTDVVPRPSPGPDGFGGRATQTALSIQMPLSSGGDGDVVSRKSSRSERRSASATPSTPASTSRNTVAVQTDEVKFDMEDNVVIGWPLSDVKMIPPPSWNLVVPKNEAPVPKTAHCKNDQNSRVVSWDNVLDGSCDKKAPNTSKVSEERVHNWDVCYCNFSEEALQVAKNLGMSQPLDERYSHSPVSAPKRSRKDERLSSSPSTPKGRMVSTWNTLQEHRHSAIFLHPVTDRDAPGYSHIVFCPVDLSTLKREIDNGTVPNSMVLLKKVFLMFTNAIMFNSTGHDVNFYAKEMYKATIEECSLTIDSRMDPFRGHNRRSRQQDDPRRRSSLTPTAQSRSQLRKRQQ